METFGTIMESCLAVEQDLDKAISKFNAIHGQTSQSLQDIISRVEEIKKEISKHPPDQILTPEEVMVLNDLAANVKQSVFQMSTEHRELHATVSRVGKSVDRHFIADYGSVAPKAESFCSDENRPYMEQAIAQHLYRQGLEEEGDTFVAEANVSGVERSCSFAALQRCAASLAAGEPAPALAWLADRETELEHSPLPFVLHRMQTLKLGAEVGVVAAIEYARQHFPRYAARHERRIQACVCALAWCRACAAPAPPAYTRLLDQRRVGAEAAELFITEACALLQLAPLSPLAGAVLAGARVLPARCDLRARLAQRDVLAAWCDDDLPLEVDLGDDGGGYHSVFACPILRQQATELNPPMRLLCGHVVSRDALHKLAMGVKFKCPYCPMEQSASDARQIYFS